MFEQDIKADQSYSQLIDSNENMFNVFSVRACLRGSNYSLENVYVKCFLHFLDVLPVAEAIDTRNPWEDGDWMAARDGNPVSSASEKAIGRGGGERARDDAMMPKQSPSRDRTEGQERSGKPQ